MTILTAPSPLERNRPWTISVAICLWLAHLHPIHAFLPHHSSLTASNKLLHGPETASWQPREVLVQQPRRSSTTTTHLRSLFRRRNYEELLQELPSQPVVQALTQKDGKLTSNTVVAADVAALAGVPLSQARRDLTALASISQGDIQVDQNGELLYVFPKDLNSVLKQNSRKYQLQQVWKKTVGPALFWLVRVGFGVALLASVLAIFSTIFFIQTSSSSSDDRDNNGFGSDERRSSSMGGGFGGGWSYWWGPSPFDFLYWGRPYGYYARPIESRYEPKEMGFLESVFSYIFGDGNPNADLAERQLALASRMIRANQGAVTAEQLAPFSLEAPSKTTSSDDDATGYVDESFVLPIVTALGGEPRVTDKGDIIYVFEELQTTAQDDNGAELSALTSAASSAASAREALTLQRAGLSPKATNRDIRRLLEYNGIDTRGALERKDLIATLEQVLPPLMAAEQEQLRQLELDSDPNVLMEREYQFSIASDLNKVLAGGLGVVNLGGALYLGNLFAQVGAAGFTGTLPGWYGAVQAIYPGLLGYAVLFNAIPAVRNLWIQRQNSQIKERNQARQKWKTALANALQRGTRGNSSLQKKLAAAKQFATQRQRAGRDGVVFDTAKASLEEMREQSNTADLAAFDEMLQQSSSSSSDDNPTSNNKKNTATTSDKNKDDPLQP